MGYRFSFNELNLVARLVEGDILSFLEDSLGSYDKTYSNIQNLSKLLSGFPKNFYNNHYYNEKIIEDIYNMQKELESLEKKNFKYNCKYEYKVKEKFNLKYLNNNVIFKRVSQFLFEIHKILGGCKVKAMILPGLEHNEKNFYLISEELLEKLMNIHPEDSCLILQPNELSSDKTIYIWKKWRRMQSALKNIEQWPGIFLWNDNDSIFIPLKENIDNELNLIFNSIHYYSGFEYLREHYYGRKRRGRMTYILHLSDLHFGTKASYHRKERLLQIIDNQMKEVEENDKIYTVVTGDLMDTPSEGNKYAVENFMKIIKYKTGNEPIIVQGNHDVRYYGVVPGFGKIHLV